jgi:hypothetical protein
VQVTGTPSPAVLASSGAVIATTEKVKSDYRFADELPVSCSWIAHESCAKSLPTATPV